MNNEIGNSENLVSGAVSQGQKVELTKSEVLAEIVCPKMYVLQVITKFRFWQNAEQ